MTAFWNFARHEAIRATGRADVAHMLWVASRMMGRWPSGARSPCRRIGHDLRLRNLDAFLYDDDPDGFACPLGAHVRRTSDQ